MLKIGVTLSSLKSSLERLVLCTERLSIKMAKGTPLNRSDSCLMNPWNSSVLMLLGCMANSNIPSSKETAAIRAYVFTLIAKSFTLILLYALDHARALKVLKVNTASSRKTIGIPSYFAFSSSSTILLNIPLYSWLWKLISFLIL